MSELCCSPLLGYSGAACKADSTKADSTTICAHHRSTPAAHPAGYTQAPATSIPPLPSLTPLPCPTPHRCVECKGDADCSAEEYCVVGWTRDSFTCASMGHKCSSFGDCNSGEFCDTAKGRCRAWASADDLKALLA
jgi:hypothetical protein